MKKLAIIGVIAFIVFGCIISAGCTSQQTATGKCPIVGQWIGKFTADGISANAVQTINADGSGTWKVIADTPDREILYEYTSTFNKYDWDGTFDKISSDGNTYTMVYDATKKTLTETVSDNVKITYSKVDSITEI